MSASGATFTGSVIAGGTFSFGRVMEATGNNRVIQNAFKITSKTGLSAEICRFNNLYYNMADITSTVNVIDENTTQGSWDPGLGMEPEPLQPGYFLAKKDLVVQPGANDYVDVQTYVTAINFSAPWPSGWAWQFGCNTDGTTAILYLLPNTRQTAIYTGYYTLMPLGLTG